ncbi:unnamed protein product [Tilletia controversa]|uniref:Cytochrome P450 n=3 Tax=Tilletia TaxID=13289 RepID=A0A8X7MUZ2_9BASI|nr:hypothetical protein CF336_g1907 [Tilletia laevis]KAE8199978.1 hypothetical protein CF328_g3090 [Tilletia controversa]KAE8262099.1 hypothetical protein A4X03_0g2717 [Tilletia caries]KAE8204938.1 hypothetical protein CF335_g2479 [Tilletia laevis]KAE8248317.1 hypothetical protein A4X06_0g3801 [Tilletia controversa]
MSSSSLISRLAGAVFPAHIPFLSSWPLYITIPALLILSPFLLAFAVALSFGTQITWRVIERHVLGTDFYSYLKSPKHTTPWWPLVGNIDHIIKSPPADGHLDFIQEVGSPVFTYRVFSYATRLCITDPVAVAYMLSSANSYDYPKPKAIRRFLTSLLGAGLVSAEGESHRRARRVLQPAFNLSAIRNLTPLFFRHANTLSTKLSSKVDKTEGPADNAFLPGQSDLAAQKSQKGKPVLDVLTWLGLTTMDVIGDAGFGHNFNALKNIEDDGLSKDALARAFSTLTSVTTDPGYFQILVFFLSRYPGFGWLEKIPTTRKNQIAGTYRLLETTSLQIIEKKRSDVMREMEVAHVSANGKPATATKEFFEDLQSSGAPKDLMHLMLRANLATDLPETVKLHDSELVGQIATLLLAGQETTSTQLTWCLWMLAQPKHQHIQVKLRQELRDLFDGRDELSYEELHSSRLLDNVTMEIMRLVSAVPSTMRVASKDDVIPLSKSYPTRDGKSSFNSLPIKKGSEIFIMIQLLNRANHIWGDTADEFEPNRWNELPEAVTGLASHKGVTGGAPANGLWTFISGPRGCIGKAFAITEFKALLAVLIRDLQFDVVEGWEVERKQGVVLRPRVKGQEKLGMQMPLYISRAP